MDVSVVSTKPLFTPSGELIPRGAMRDMHAAVKAAKKIIEKGEQFTIYDLKFQVGEKVGHHVVKEWAEVLTEYLRKEQRWHRVEVVGKKDGRNIYRATVGVPQ